MSHSHSYMESHAPQNQRILLISLAIITTFMIVEASSGYFFNSLALLADAGHMASDSLSLLLSLFALYIGKKMPNKIMNFGYRRAETLVALVNGSTLVIIAIYIIIEAIGRLVNPSPIMSLPMIAVAVLGLIMNIVVARIMLSSDQSNLNMKAAYLHVVADTLGSVAAILAGLGMYFFNWLWLDAVASAAVSIIIFRSGFNVCRTAIRLLMQGVPTNVDVAKVEQMLLEPKEIKSITRMQIWGLTEDEIYLSAQLCFAEDVDTETERQILHNLAKRFHEMDIHATLQNDLAVYFEQHGKAEIAHHH